MEYGAIDSGVAGYKAIDSMVARDRAAESSAPEDGAVVNRAAEDGVAKDGTPTSRRKFETQHVEVAESGRRKAIRTAEPGSRAVVVRPTGEKSIGKY